MTNELINSNSIEKAFPEKLSTTILKNVGVIGVLKHVKLLPFKFGEGPTPRPVLVEAEVQPSVFNPTRAQVAGINQSVSYHKQTFNPKRGLSRYTVSKRLDNDTGVIDESIMSGAAKSAAVLVEQNMLSTGFDVSGDFGMQAIAKAVDVEVKDVKFTGVTVEGKDYGVLDVENLALAVREVTGGFTTAAQPIIILDSSVQDVINPDGTTAMTYENLDDNTFCRIIGKTVYFADLGLNNQGFKTSAIVLNPDGYGVAMSDLQIRKIPGDTQNAMAETISYNVDFYVDAKVINPKAVKVLGYSSVTSPTPPEEPTA